MDTPPKTGGEYKKQSDMQKITCGQNIPPFTTTLIGVEQKNTKKNKNTKQINNY